MGRTLSVSEDTNTLPIPGMIASFFTGAVVTFGVFVSL